MTDYITSDELRDYIGSDTTNFQSVVSSSCTVASRMVEQATGRYFYQDSVATARDYAACNSFQVDTDDISTTTGLIVATDDQYDRSYSTSWTITTDFIVHPVNPSASGTTRPYTSLIATAASKWFPRPWYGQREPVRVTAQWGWAAVPDDVKQATLILGAWLFKMKDAPGGTLGLDGWGPAVYKENKNAALLLGPYMKDPVSVG